jgi:hypothetical protein
VTADVGISIFQAINVGATLTAASLQSLIQANTGNCTLVIASLDRSNLPPASPPPTPGTGPTVLDAGDPITVKGPVGTKPMPKGKDGAYAASFATVTNIPLPGGLPPIATGGPAFLEPGTYTLSNGGGGADIGPFTVDLQAPAPISWDNIDQVATIDRTQGVTIKWSGGDPTTVVGIAGSATQIQGTVTVTGAFVCTAKTSAGQFSVPPFVTLAMPAIAATASPSNIGNLTVSNILFEYVTIPGVDLSIFNWTSGLGRNVAFQ